MIDRADAVVSEQGREDFLEHLAVGQHVGDAARNTQVVFQHGKAAVRKPHQICTADADVYSARHGEIAHLAPEVAAAVNQFSRHNSVCQNSPAMVNILKKEIQGRNSLRESAFNLAPFVVRNDAWQQVVRENSFRSFVIAIDRKRDSLMQKREVGGLLALPHLLRRKP